MLKEKQTYFYLNNLVNIPIDGKIPTHYDQEALTAFFKETVVPKTMTFPSLKERFTFLITEDYIDEKLVQLYSFHFIEQLDDKLRTHPFAFRSFMGAYKFYNQYAMQTDDKQAYLEDFVDRVLLNALYLGNGDEKLATALAEELITQRFQPATPTFLNAGKKRRGEMVSCFLLDLNDSMLSIGRGLNSALQLSKIGGGVGLNLSNLRAAGDPIKKITNASSGVIPVMKLLEDAFSYSNQLGQRNGAGVVYLNVFHPDILSFLATKKENADEKIRVKTLSLGLTVPDKYYELLKTNQPMALFSPYDVEKVYKKPFSYVDLTKEYDAMVAHPDIKKNYIQARELEQEISRLQQESGYPYILNIDTANRTNPVKGKIIMSNLCSEILQPQEPSELNDDLSYQTIGTDISCNLGSVNLMNLIKSPDFAQSVERAVRALTTVSELTTIHEVPSIKKGNDLYHTIGLGAMGLHTVLATNQIHYGSPEALEFTEACFYALNYYSLVASHKIAQEKGQTLKKAVQKHGLYHRNRLAVAPNGSISYVNETSASLHPITQLVEQRQENKVGSVFYPAPFLSNETLPYYTSAYDIDQRKIIDTYAIAQKHIDQGMSLTLFMRSVLPAGLYEWKNDDQLLMTTRDLNRLRNYAWTKGIKSIYYVRTFTPDDEFTSANQCEACMI